MPRRKKQNEREIYNFAVLECAAGRAREIGKGEPSAKQVNFVAHLLDDCNVDVSEVIPDKEKSIFTSSFASFLITNLRAKQIFVKHSSPSAIEEFEKQFAEELQVRVKAEAEKAETPSQIGVIKKILEHAAILTNSVDKSTKKGKRLLPASEKQINFAATLIDDSLIDINTIIPNRDTTILTIGGASKLISDLKDYGGKYKVGNGAYFVERLAPDGIDAGLVEDEKAHENLCRERGVGY